MVAKRQTVNVEKIVPDTSVIIEGLLSRKIDGREILPQQVMIHEAVLAELEHQANQNKSIGFLGIDEIDRLKQLSGKLSFELVFAGKRPSAYEINQAKLGEIDSMIRELAFENDATLLTTDKVQARIGKAKGMQVMFLEVDVIKKKLALESFFDSTTMSVHLRENVTPFAKKGVPGKWDFVKVRDTPLTRDEVRSISDEIIEEAGVRKECFIEIERTGSTIVQFENYRIVITRPPFSDGWEITAVRPVKKLVLDEYELPEKVKSRIGEQAEGILIAGAPGQGKSTFAQALAEYYADQDKIVKTVEAPRDLQLPDTITQYAISHGSPQEIHDVLLLSRPDYTIFDEMRNTEDFRLFADMRLSGVGMIGVIHATNAIDAIQRFIGRIELGTIPQIVDTVLFIKNGGINKVFNVRMEVKVPSGMTEADLARPVVVVYDFVKNKLEFEIYSYGEETVVVPVQAEAADPPARALAKREVEREMQRYADEVVVEFPSEYGCIVKVPESAIASIIGKQGSNIEKLQQKLGIHINVEALEGGSGRRGRGSASVPSEHAKPPKPLKQPDGEPVPYQLNVKKNALELYVDSRFANRQLDVYVGDEFLVELHVGKKAMVKIKKDNNIGKALLNSMNRKGEIRVFA
ncbi:MAG: PINc/VapC family ATPase [Nanoarchaeota archaeon]|nr:PINc/VapC family ATPase [Nanoarchaeota archaeon]